MKARILEEVRHLPVEQRMELAEAIWDTVAEDADVVAVPVSAAHRAELDRRLADLLASPLPRGASVEDLLTIAGTLDDESARQMREVIEDGCEQVDPEER